MKPSPALVTTALPYANGPLHLGHLVGYIQADIWVRARRMAGGETHFVCADDAHGTPIMLAAEKAGQSPEEFIRAIQVSHEKDFADFGVAFDHYHSTHSDENRELATLIYERLRDGKYAQRPSETYIASRKIQQLFDPVREMFLPDRYIKGDCPNCGSPDQYGDNCEVCGKAYSPTELKNPRSVMSGAVPELRESEHYFFELGKFEAFLRAWLKDEVAHPAVKAKLDEWLEGGLRDWDISRDKPYFGFEIPGTTDKYFYVWLDAPIGYLASFQAYCRAKGLDFARFTEASRNERGETEMHHFIGKDIVNFHGLFWPAMLKGSGFRPPTKLHVNGYLTVNGARMSKSRGTFIMARTFLDAGLEPETLRYYYAAKSGAGVDDLDLNLDDYAARTNADLVGKFVNIASRCAKLLETNFDNNLIRFPNLTSEEKELGDSWGKAKGLLASVSAHTCMLASELYSENNFAGVIRNAMTAADQVNEYIAQTAPWALAKDPTRRDELHLVLTVALQSFADIAGVLKPILPTTITRAEQFLGVTLTIDKRVELEGRKISTYNPIFTRIDPKQIEAMIEASKEDLKPAVGATQVATPDSAKAAAKPVAADAAPTKTTPPAVGVGATIGIDDFAKLDLRIGAVLECGFVEGSDKLLRFLLDAGELGQRQIFSGIRAGYPEPEKLVGRKVVFIANLAPRKMRFGVSEGMILSAGGDDGLFLLDADAGALPGMTVK